MHLQIQQGQDIKASETYLAYVKMLKSLRIFLMEFPVNAILVFFKCNFHSSSTKTYLRVNLIHRNALGHLRSKVI